MSYAIEYLRNPNAILVTINTDFDFATEYQDYHGELIGMLEKQSDLITVIVDMRDVKVSINELMLSSRESRTQVHRNPAQHPNTQDLFLVTNSTLMQASVDGFKKLGIVKKLSVFKTVDEALKNVF